MVTKLLRVPDPPRPPDAADALALAICHVWRGSAPMSTGLRPAVLDRPVRPAAASMRR